jgi:hypothetical protein|tara:strand:+ start:3609 stop:3872 length:264 start_codon:yes stop_codon:yes gene_type:complete
MTSLIRLLSCLAILSSSSAMAQQLCYAPSKDIDPKISESLTANFYQLIKKANEQNAVLCESIQSEAELKDAEKLISETATEETFWIE